MKKLILIIFVLLNTSLFPQYKSVQDILNKVYVENGLSATYKSTGDVFNAVFDQTNNALQITIVGDSIVVSRLVVNDSLRVEGTSLLKGAVTVKGQILYMQDIINITTDAITLDTTQTRGAIITNTGDNDANVITLPCLTSYRIGFKVTFVLTTAFDVNINPGDNDQILVLTNAAGDAISSDATVGSMITLVSVSATQWLPMGYTGAWADVN